MYVVESDKDALFWKLIPHVFSTLTQTQNQCAFEIQLSCEHILVLGRRHCSKKGGKHMTNVGLII